MNETIDGGYGEWGAGDDWDVDDEDGGEINSYDSDGLERYELPFRELDEFSKITNDSKYGLVGVMADVKKATECQGIFR